MKKSNRHDLRTDDITDAFVDALIKKLTIQEKKPSKNEIYRLAVQRMAHDMLDDKEYTAALITAKKICIRCQNHIDNELAIETVEGIICSNCQTAADY